MVAPDYWLVKIDEQGFWDGAEIKGKITAINGVYAFDRNLHVHICSFTPLYEMYFMGTDYEEAEGLSEEARENLNCLILENECAESVTYMEVGTVEKVLKGNPERGSKVTEVEADEDPFEEIREGWVTGSLLY